jgi:phosphate-selective porin OprO and OprP
MERGPIHSVFKRCRLQRSRGAPWFGSVVLLMLCALPTVAGAQQPGPANGPVADSIAGEDGTLADRVAELERELARIRGKTFEKQRQAAGQPTFTVIGRAFVDTCSFSQDALNRAQFGEAEGGTKFRTTRLGAMGAMFDVFEWEVSVDFAGTAGVAGETVQQTAFRNVYLQMTDLPWIQNVRVGHFKEPASLEEVTSTRFASFPERSFVRTFIPAFNTGIQAMGHSEAQDATFAIGMFGEMPDAPPVQVGDIGGTAVTMRGTWLPWYDEATEGRGLLHLGGYYSYRGVDDGTLRFRSRANNTFGPHVVDTGTMIGVANWHLVGAEVAFVYGPLSIQSEYTRALVKRSAAADPEFDALYVEVTYFLTGENRAYVRRQGNFTRVTPLENFFRVRDAYGNVSMGKGAWQLAYRYSTIDLVDAGIDGNRAGAHSMGVNWYLTPYARLMAHYIHATCNVGRPDQPGGPGASSLDAVLMRAQFDF